MAKRHRNGYSVLALVLFAAVACSNECHNGYCKIPPPLSPFHEYPNPLNITDADRARFRDVVRFPRIRDANGKKIPNIEILNFTRPSLRRQLATEEERRARQQDVETMSRRKKWWNFFASATTLDNNDHTILTKGVFAVGRYDENRVNMYESGLFETLDDDGKSVRRTVHVGIDLDGPVGTRVYAFTKGKIHAVGYNPELGDYGNVIVIEHWLSGDRTVYALYGHLSNASIKGRKKGDRIRAGQCIGKFGDIHENGGWFIPHVHFQLALSPPDTHDLPGAVSESDRHQALFDYPDPRYVLGALY